VVLCFRNSLLDGTLKEVRVAADPPSSPRIREYVFGCRVIYGSEMDGLVLAFSDMLRPNPHADLTLNSLLEDYAREITAQALSSLPFGARVTALVVAGLETNSGVPTASDIADRMKITTRTLHRRLADEGGTFRTILDEQRSQFAYRFLREGMSVREVSLRLGYSHVNAFNRAFYRWNARSAASVRRSAPVSSIESLREPGAQPQIKR
jgi:AraC-like DNA-binding protein